MPTASRVPVCFGYGRHSTYKQELTETVQQAKCLEYYQRELASLGVAWGGFYYDRAVSGGKRLFSEREQGRIVFATAQPGDHIVITRLDRGFRKLSDGINTLEQFANRGVHLHSIYDRIDTSTASGALVTNILLAIAQFKRDLDSERTKESIHYLQSQGLPYHRTPPMGWKIRVVNGQRVLRVNTKERDFIQTLSELNSEGKGHKALALMCWKNAKLIQQDRDFGNPDAIRHALWALALGFPKVSGRMAVKKLYREAERLGKV